MKMLKSVKLKQVILRYEINVQNNTVLNKIILLLLSLSLSPPPPFFSLHNFDTE